MKKERKNIPRSRKIIYAVIINLFILLLFEGYCRLTQDENKYVYSETVGYELVPGYEGRRERVNALGLRGLEIEAEKKPGQFRILAMGGSTTFGHKVGSEETWPFCLEKKLRKKCGNKVEVLNGGISGWGMEQILLSLRHRRLDELRPDLVLVYSGWNDPRKDNGLVKQYEAKARSSPKKNFWHNIAFVKYIDKKLSKLNADNPEIQGDGTAWMEQNRKFCNIRLEGIPPVVDGLAALSRDKGVPIVFVSLTGLAQLPPPAESRPDLRERYKELLTHNWPEDMEMDDLYAMAREEYLSATSATRESTARNGLILLDVATTVLAGINKHGSDSRDARWIELFRDRAHLEPPGNEAIADALVQLLAQHDLLPRN